MGKIQGGRARIKIYVPLIGEGCQSHLSVVFQAKAYSLPDPHRTAQMMDHEC